MNREECCKKIDDLIDLVGSEIGKVVKKGDINSAELDAMGKAVKLLVDAEIYRGMVGYNDGSTYGANKSYGPYVDSEWPHYPGHGDPGYSGRMRTPSMTRHVSMGIDNINGYSGHSIDDRCVAALESLMAQAQSDYERREIEKKISILKTMK